VLLFQKAKTFHNDVLPERAGGLHEPDSEASEVIANEGSISDAFLMWPSSTFHDCYTLQHIEMPKIQACIIR
jgi:hypothetical protein